MSHYTASLVRDQAPFGMGGFVEPRARGTEVRVRQGDTIEVRLDKCKGGSVDIHATSGVGGGTSLVMTDPGRTVHRRLQGREPWRLHLSP